MIRALLVAGICGAAFVVGCTSPARKPVTDPDAAALQAARTSELALLQGYAEGTEGHAAHLAHLHALGGVVPTAGPTAAPTQSPATESTTIASLTEAARRAQRGSTAALLASIAASHAVMSAGHRR